MNNEYKYLGSLMVDDFEDFSLTQEALSFDYFANCQGVTRFETVSLTSEDAAALTFREEAAQTFKRHEGSLNKKLIEEARERLRAEKDKGRQHLETMIVKNRLTEAQAEVARGWFEDKSWEKGTPDVQRAARAVFRAPSHNETAVAS